MIKQYMNITIIFIHLLFYHHFGKVFYKLWYDISSNYGFERLKINE
jgi:hypothetical protein